jgi:putative ABC transport system substrate-binding protein
MLFSANRISPKRASACSFFTVARSLWVSFLFACSHAYANKSEHILFVLSKDSPEYQKIVDSITSDWTSDQALSYRILPYEKQTKLDQTIEKTDIVISLGTAAANEILARKISQPVITTLITESAFDSLADKYYRGRAAAVDAGVNPIFLDQPFERRLQLACRLIKKLDKVSVMVGPLAKDNQSVYTSSIKEKNLTAQMIAIDPDENPIRQLDPVIKTSDVFIPVADSHLINVTTAKWALQLGYRYRVPIIGYSSNYVDAGALASVYSSPEDVSKQTEELIQSLLSKTHKHRIHPPKYCTIKFNKSVAWHLNLEIPEELEKQNGRCKL